MWVYLVRRLLLLIPTVLGIVLITFCLFSLVATDPARQYAGKHATPEVLASIRAKMGLNKPRLALNVAAYRRTGHVTALLDNQFFDVLLMRFPKSMQYNETVWSLFWRKAPVSLAVQLPVFVLSLGLTLATSLACAALRGRAFDSVMTIGAIVMMSAPGVSVYLLAQWLLGAKLRLFPVAGWDGGYYALQYAVLPILVSVCVGFGGSVRFYRAVALEEVNADYVRTGRAKGVGEGNLLLVHVLRNILVPVITNTVTALPLLFLGAVILEQTFQIPGLGSLLDTAVLANDRPVVMFIVYVTSVLYCLALVVNDIAYTWADPRVVLR
ncbi:MAG: ABC transporter permease [Tepidisphaeraceae bacterium]